MAKTKNEKIGTKIDTKIYNDFGKQKWQKPMILKNGEKLSIIILDDSFLFFEIQK